MRKGKKSIFIFVVVLLICIGLYCVLILPLNGSVIRKAILTHRVRDYVVSTYGEGLQVNRAVYDFKIGSYLCHVQSNISEDTHFTVYEGRDGALEDRYDLEVLQKENTIFRLSRGLDVQVEQVFLPLYSRDCVLASCFFEQGPLDMGTAEVRDRFTLDMPLDMLHLPLPLELTLWVVCETPSWEQLCDCFREAKRVADELGWQVSYYSIALHTPATETDGKPIASATEFIAYQVPYEKIEADDFCDYLRNIP